MDVMIANMSAAGRYRLVRDVMRLSDRDAAAVRALVESLLQTGGAPSLSDDEEEQIMGAMADAAEGGLSSWAEAKRRLEALP